MGLGRFIIPIIKRCYEKKWKNIFTCYIYQSEQLTTEQVFIIKILAEKGIPSDNPDMFLLLLEM